MRNAQEAPDRKLDGHWKLHFRTRRTEACWKRHRERVESFSLGRHKALAKGVWLWCSAR